MQIHNDASAHMRSLFNNSLSLVRALLGLGLGWFALAAQDATPNIRRLQWISGRPVIDFAPVPSAQSYAVYGTTNLAWDFQLLPGLLKGFQWTGRDPWSSERGLFQVRAQLLSAEAITAANLLNRVGYGPTPDELEEIRRIGVTAWINRQLAPETIVENLDQPVPFSAGWRKVVATGMGSSSALYIYLNGPGNVYIDNIRLVAGGTENPSAVNLVRNGNFELPLGVEWGLATNVNTSARSADFVQNGAACLHLVSTSSGSTRSSSFYQDLSPGLAASQVYTLSFWYYSANTNRILTARLSGSGIFAEAPLHGRTPTPSTYAEALKSGGNLTQLRSWHLLRALQSKRQLNEVLRQFCENHFVTEHSKSAAYFDSLGYRGESAAQPATQIEFDENQKWQAALLRPAVTFHDLLRISAESPAMIIYLDTVNSRGAYYRGRYLVANENYARELCELFCMGVDNGYDQGDIVQLSRVWTGWTTEVRAPADIGNPFAPRSTVYIDPTSPNKNAITNRVGKWTLRYLPTRHDPRAKYIFHQKDTLGNPLPGRPCVVPARFGPPWAGRSYGIAFPSSSYQTNTIQEGYQVLAHMANLPFTQEFIVVKLCQLFIHDGFRTGYNFTDRVTSPEEDLVKAAMLAWEIPPGGGPKGQLRPVLRVILNSSMFRSTLSSQHKVRTPLEFALAAIRAFRTPRATGGFTADSDGLGIQTMLTRTGRMRLFDRAEPDGYPEAGAPWISAGTLAERLRYVQALALRATGVVLRPAGEIDVNTSIDPVALLRERKPAGLTDAGVAADYFLDLLFPAEGAANLYAYRELAVRFLNTADNGTKASAYSSLTPGSMIHDERLRGMVAFLMTTPRFQEQ